jgi:tRNA pseudouridine38-40 synthase
MRYRYKAILAYDGTAYHGFQRQENASPTVQGVLEEVLSSTSGQQVTILAAGRTDAGVHATGQVVAFDLIWRHSPSDLCNALNANLPSDIAVYLVEPAGPGFHPRYDALSRTYVYRLYVSPVRDPFKRWRAWHLSRPLAVEAIAEAARHLLGTHDFSAFGSPPQGDNPVRTVYQARWDTRPAGDQHTFTITANAFLYRMVRRVVGGLVAVGQGQVSVEQFTKAVAVGSWLQGTMAAPAHGLTLTAVQYPDRLSQ